MKEDIRSCLLTSGAIAVGFTNAGEISEPARESYKKWIGEGNHGEMSYLERHTSLKSHTDSVLPGAKTIISLAFSYKPKEFRNSDLPHISAYAYSEDYHVTLREILKPTVECLKNKYGGKWRICIDSAPVAERYWALKCGIGKRGLNGTIIIDGYGGFIFLVEILTTLEIAPDKPSDSLCNRCGKCIAICPSKALRGDGTMNASKCINYLTIEKKGELTKEEIETIISGEGFLLGCDSCLKVCPHNDPGLNSERKETNLFNLSDKIRNLNAESILEMDELEFQNLFRDTPLTYVGYDTLRRNALYLRCAKNKGGVKSSENL